MSKKMLFTASTMSHIENFHLPYIEEFRRQGWEVKAVALPVSKRYFSLQNLRAINHTRKMLKEERFDVISAHTTLAGIVTRLAVLLTGSLRKTMKVFYTSHGYLFHDDRSMKKWAYLLPEMLCGRVTDVLMVMNHEDLEIAKKYKLCGKSNQIHYINGMGIDLTRFQPRQATAEQKKAFGIDEDDFVFVYAAEFSKRKNHELLLKGFAGAVEKLKNLEKSELEKTDQVEQLEDIKNSDAPNGVEYSPNRLKLVLAGNGALLEEMKALAARLGIEKQVVFLGYVKNVEDLYPCCNVAVSTSRIEGLPFNVMEAMACGLPVIASDIKGHRELIEHGVNGMLFGSGQQENLSNEIIRIRCDAELRVQCKNMCVSHVIPFSLANVIFQINGAYKDNL